MPVSRLNQCLVVCSFLPAVAVAADPVVFEPAAIMEWSTKAFAGETRYELTQSNGRAAVHAECRDGAASGLILERDIDLTETPVVEWRWRAGRLPNGADETQRAGDDYAARLYAVDANRLLRWRTRAVNYVWSSGMERGADWPNAYLSHAHMVAVRSGPPADPGRWQTQRRNLREDFQRYHGRDVQRINALAIMTDCDDTGEPAEAWYGTIRLLPAE